MAKINDNFDGNMVLCYKICEGKQISCKENDEEINYTYMYDAANPMFSFSEYKDAAKAWERRVKEGFRDHMLFIADFGVLSPRQEKIVKWGKANTRPCRENPKDKNPYVQIAEYHKKIDNVSNTFVGNMYGTNHLVLRTRAGEKHYEKDDRTCFEQVDFYRKHGTPFKLASIHTWTDAADNYKTKYTRLRMICSSHQLKSYAEMGMYIGCKKIEVHECYRKPQTKKTVNFTDYKELTEEEEIKRKCTHRTLDGTDTFVKESDGTVRCALCGYTLGQLAE